MLGSVVPRATVLGFAAVSVAGSALLIWSGLAVWQWVSREIEKAVRLP